MADRGHPPDLPERPAEAVHVIERVEGLRALSDPLRLRILEVLCGRPRTTRQVADVLGEGPTRLYHHVDALERAGLIRLVATRPKRGTLEKYYQAVARQFRAAAGLLPGAPEPGDGDHWASLGAQLLEMTSRELRRRAGEAEEAAPDQVIFARVEARGSAESLRRLRDRIEALLGDVEALDPEGGPDEEGMLLTLALYPRRPSDR